MTTQIQRRLILVRHAKAAPEDVDGDHARALSARGREDAVALGRWLAGQVQPQLVLCSTAVRTRETLAALGHFSTDFRDTLYHASAGELLAQIQGVDDGVRELMLVGHNPGMHGLLALLVHDCAHEADEQRMAMKFPTSACAILSIKADGWADVAPHTARLETLRWNVDG